MSSSKLDVQVLKGSPASIGEKICLVAAGADTIYPGEPVARALGAAVVTALADAKPVVATDYLEGIATSTSTQTASAAGVVNVRPLVDNEIYIAKAKLNTTVDTQAEYDAIVGDRLLFDLTSGTYTVDVAAGDSATAGLVVENMNVLEHPGCVAFSIRAGARSLA